MLRVEATTLLRVPWVGAEASATRRRGRAFTRPENETPQQGRPSSGRQTAAERAWRERVLSKCSGDVCYRTLDLTLERNLLTRVSSRSGQRTPFARGADSAERPEGRAAWMPRVDGAPGAMDGSPPDGGQWR